MQALIRSKSAGITGGRGTAGPVLVGTFFRHQDNNLVLIGVTRHVPFGFIKALDISRRVLAFYFFCNERIGGISQRASLTIH